MRRPASALLLLLLLALTGPAHLATITTTDTTLTVTAAENAESITSFRDTQHDWLSNVAGIRSGPFVPEATIDGQSIALVWRLKSETDETSPAPRHSFTYTCDEPALELISIWTGSSGPGPVEHELNLANRGSKTVLVPFPASLALDTGDPDSGAPLETFWVEKGAGHPSDQGIHRTPITDGFSQSLVSTAYAGEHPPEPIPWVAVLDPHNRRGWYVGMESSARVRINLRRLPVEKSANPKLTVDAGLAAGATDLTRLDPGETLRLPAAFLGCFEGGIDEGCNRFRQWVGTNIRPAVHDPRYPLLVNNSWGGGMAINDGLCRKMIDESAALGLELFHIDAGWFRGVGDWRPDAKKFPHGLAPIADYAHSKGLKFGLWVGWTQGGVDHQAAGPDRPLSVFDAERRDWFPEDAPPDWRPADFTGKTLCLGDSSAVAWCLAELRRIIKEDQLDLLEHDQAIVVDRCTRADHLHTASRLDVSFRAAQGYYSVYDTLRRENPDLLFENCVNGGRMVDFGALRRAHYVSITDTYDPLSNRRAFYDAAYLLPPAMCECYIENRPEPTIPRFIAMLRSGMMGWCTIMTDTAHWTPEEHAAAKRQFELYKTVLRPLINHADLYHVTPRPDGVAWDGIEYWDPATGSGVLFAFRGSTSEQEHHFILQGIPAATRCSLTSENGSLAPLEMTGEALGATGVTLRLPEAETSDLILIRQTAPR
jgi:Melibiase